MKSSLITGSLVCLLTVGCNQSGRIPRPDAHSEAQHRSTLGLNITLASPLHRYLPFSRATLLRSFGISGPLEPVKGQPKLVSGLNEAEAISVALESDGEAVRMVFVDLYQVQDQRSQGALKRVVDFVAAQFGSDQAARVQTQLSTLQDASTEASDLEEVFSSTSFQVGRRTFNDKEGTPYTLIRVVLARAD